MSKLESLEDKLRRVQSSEATLAHAIGDVQKERDELKIKVKKLQSDVELAREMQDVRRRAITQEICECLKLRGFWVPKDWSSSDVITAVARVATDFIDMKTERDELRAKVERLEKENNRLGSWDTTKSDIVTDIEKFLKDNSRENDKPTPWVFTPGEKEALDQYLLAERDELRSEVERLREVLSQSERDRHQIDSMYDDAQRELKTIKAQIEDYE